MSWSSVSYLFTFSHCSWGSQGKNTEWFAIPFSSGSHSVRPLHHNPSVLGGPTRHGLVSLSQIRLWSYDQMVQFSVNVVSVCLPSVENSERDGNTRLPHLPLEKPVCRSGSNSQNWTWNNRLVPNRKRSTSRLYIVTLLI